LYIASRLPCLHQALGKLAFDFPSGTREVAPNLGVHSK
jgi:hypothetical protein